MNYQEKCAILDNRRIQGGYYRIDLQTGRIAAAVQPGQFAHLQVPALEHRLLRRPFSICNVEPETGLLTIVYKVVGEGTEQLARTPAGASADIIGPLGKGFTMPAAGARAIIVAGGYGCAATYLLARRAKPAPLCLLGARTAADVLLLDEFRALGCEVRIATDDGSLGHRGFVTGLLEDALRENPTTPPRIYACGPGPMLRAVGRVVAAAGAEKTTELSLDHAMCCGVGACFACVIKLKADNADGWEFVRTCRNGPVFPAEQVWWDA